MFQLFASIAKTPMVQREPALLPARQDVSCPATLMDLQNACAQAVEPLTS